MQFLAYYSVCYSGCVLKRARVFYMSEERNKLFWLPANATSSSGRGLLITHAVATLHVGWQFPALLPLPHLLCSSLSHQACCGRVLNRQLTRLTWLRCLRLRWRLLSKLLNSVRRRWGEGVGVAWWEVRGSRTVGGERIFWGFFVFLPCVGLPKVIYCAARWSSPIDTANCDVDCGLTPNGTEVHAAQFSWGSFDRRKLISNDWREREVANSLVDSADLQTDRAVGWVAKKGWGVHRGKRVSPYIHA